MFLGNGTWVHQATGGDMGIGLTLGLSEDLEQLWGCDGTQGLLEGVAGSWDIGLLSSRMASSGDSMEGTVDMSWSVSLGTWGGR